jgi:periplasmic divalent cation tolerance protein
MESYVVCFVTVDTRESAEIIAVSLVQEKIAACVNIISQVRSIYSWKNKICDEKEFLLIIKTKYSLFETLKTRVKQAHPYEIPEIICFNILDGLPEYLNWINDSTQNMS